MSGAVIRYQPGDLAFSRGSSLFSWLVRRISGPLAHVRVIDSAEGDTIEAGWPLVARGAVQPGDRIVHVPYPDAVHRTLALDWATACLGEPYSLISLVSDTLGWMGCPWYIGAPNEKNCAQLALYTVQVGGLLETEDRERVTPSSLFVALVAQGGISAS